jgi:hypothetical protein
MARTANPVTSHKHIHIPNVYTVKPSRISPEMKISPTRLLLT